MIHVAYSFHDGGHYSKFVGTSIVSIFGNLPPPPPDNKVTIHILHDNTLTDDNRDKFGYIAGQYNQTIKFYNVQTDYANISEKVLKGIKGSHNKRLTLGAYYRLLIPFVISQEIKKIIYLDGDIIVNLDIRELWDIDLDDKILGMRPYSLTSSSKRLKKIFPYVNDNLVKIENLFITGTIIFDTDKYRKSLSILKNAITFINENPQYAKMDDEAVLNYCFSEYTKKLALKYNATVGFSRKKGIFDVEDKKIVHYAGSKTLKMNLDDVFNELFFRYFVKTPFFGEETIGNLHQAISRFYNNQKDFLLRMMNLLSKRQRAFFIEATEFEKMKKVFDIADNEEKVFSDDKTFSLVDNKVVSLPRDATVEELIKAMQKSKGKKVFYIVNKNYGSIRNQLKSLGFVEWQDFLNGREVISEQLGGVQFLTHDFVKQM